MQVQKSKESLTELKNAENSIKLADEEAKSEKEVLAKDLEDLEGAIQAQTENSNEQTLNGLMEELHEEEKKLQNSQEIQQKRKGSSRLCQLILSKSSVKIAVFSTFPSKSRLMESLFV